MSSAEKYQNHIYDLPLYFDPEEIEVGVDEVGRGCLMGPVVTAAVIFPKKIDMSAFDHLPKFTRNKQICHVPIIRDSKKLSDRQKAIANDFIKEFAIDYSTSSLDNNEIDRINILNATIKCMHMSLDGLSTKFTRILVDGTQFKVYVNETGDFVPHACIVSGDASVASIAAASILAKVERDKWVADLCESRPDLDEQYDWLSNKGYGTAKHIEGIRSYGITEYHRVSYKTCK